MNSLAQEVIQIYQETQSMAATAARCNTYKSRVRRILLREGIPIAATGHPKNRPRASSRSQDEKVLQGLQAGMDPGEICEMYGVARSTVTRVLRENNLTLAQVTPKPQFRCCPTCRETYPVSHFYRERGWCKPCTIKYTKQRAKRYAFDIHEFRRQRDAQELEAPPKPLLWPEARSRNEERGT